MSKSFNKAGNCDRPLILIITTIDCSQDSTLEEGITIKTSFRLLMNKETHMCPFVQLTFQVNNAALEGE